LYTAGSRTSKERLHAHTHTQREARAILPGLRDKEIDLAPGYGRRRRGIVFDFPFARCGR